METLWVGLSADDLADAYHGVPNAEEQLGVCVVALRCPQTDSIIFLISYAHLFGLSAAVVNFNRFPELMTAVVRRIGACPSWHFFDDQGTLDFKLSDTKAGHKTSISAPSFVGKAYDLVGRPFKPSKHLPSAAKQTHLGLLNNLENLLDGIALEPKEGKLE